MCLALVLGPVTLLFSLVDPAVCGLGRLASSSGGTHSRTWWILLSFGFPTVCGLSGFVVSLRKISL